MKTSSRGGGNEPQIAATFEPRVVKESKLIKQKKKKNQDSQLCVHVSTEGED